MISRLLRWSFLLAAIAAFSPVSAQVPSTPAPSSDADRLAAEMRVLATNPRDLDALATAAELTLGMGDATAATALLNRAERVDPHNARVKADLGAVLVHAERPNQALRLFAEAESLGWPAAKLAPERGLAYDLTGDNERAQREYRIALVSASDDETVRRYALSLGIVGERARAEAVLDPLLRRSDRAAWRDRAFVLAMTGDAAGAEHIVTTMMPGAVATGLAGFFPRLATMNRVDRAFAVTFGELAPSPERLADSGRPPVAPTRAAQATPPPMPVTSAAEINTRVAAASTSPAPTRPSRHAEPTTRLAAAGAPTPTPVVSRPVPAQTAAPTPTRSTQVAAAARTDSVLERIIAGIAVPVGELSATPSASDVSSGNSLASKASATRSADATGKDCTETTRTRRGRKVISHCAVKVAATTAPTPDVASSSDCTPRKSTHERHATTKACTTEQAALPAVPDCTPTRATHGRHTTTQRCTEEAAARTPVIDPPADCTPKRTTRGHKNTARCTEEAAAKTDAVQTPDCTPKRTTRGHHAAPARCADDAAKVADDATACTPRHKGTRKTACKTEAQTADTVDNNCPPAKKGSHRKPAACRAGTRSADTESSDCPPSHSRRGHHAATKPCTRETARYWVQVAGGATDNDLGKAWTKVKSQAPGAFKGKQGWTTPLRATNRVLTGPFESEDAAQAFVNQLSKSGVSGFVFSSEAGQKVSRLPASK